MDYPSESGFIAPNLSAIKEMNRLIIIGNGFDIAHGIKSKFKHFIEYYLNIAYEGAKSNAVYEDELLRIELTFPMKFEIVNDIEGKDIFYIFKKMINQSDTVDLQFKSYFFKVIYNKYVKLGWVDIEIEFFKALLGDNETYLLTRVEKVNSEMSFLKKQLIIYLKEQEILFDKNINSEYFVKCFCEDINSSELMSSDMVMDKLPPSFLYFLNFNYTQTLDTYFKTCQAKIESKMSMIHGDLNNNACEPIFGFGDENDKKYLAFEEQHDNQFFEHMKSYQYLQSQQYNELTRFMDGSNFQIHIYGHSCGVSDRTLLNEIFEHENCVSIKIFYHKHKHGDDYMDKIFNTSRHFTNKGIFRKKVVSKPLSSPMPQPIDE